jgi:hypothetical protein
MPAFRRVGAAVFIGKERMKKMQISVYDTYVQRPDGRRMHFDILVPATVADRDTVLQYGRTYLAAKGLQATELKAEKCNYCHMESATALVAQEIAERGFAILEMENCT